MAYFAFGLVASGAAALQVERQQAGDDLFVTEIVRPAVGGEDGLVQRPVGQVEPGRALVVQVGQGALFELGFGQAGRVEPGVAQADQLGGAGGDGLDLGGVLRLAAGGKLQSDP